ncbi:MAG: hypothetical protein AB4368_14755 [Xenococcaceae cyanobacterium]
MKPLVLEEAKRLGFFYQLDEENIWQIFPQRQGATWKLSATNSRWILSLKNIPQLYLDSKEAITQCQAAPDRLFNHASQKQVIIAFCHYHSKINWAT